MVSQRWSATACGNRTRQQVNKVTKQHLSFLLLLVVGFVVNDNADMVVACVLCLYDILMVFDNVVVVVIVAVLLWVLLFNTVV